ncbi:MAG: hypothetical protein WCZ15_00690 [Patescibacteria group bacterium]
MNRRKATVFVIENGYDNLPQSLKTFLDTRSEHAYYCVDYPLANVLWVDAGYIDEVMSNSEFWDMLLSGEIKSKERFKIRVELPITTEPTLETNFSNDNLKEYFTIEDSSLLSGMVSFLSYSDYQENYILTSGKVDNIPDIKNWIRTRKIDSEFDLRRSDEVLKDGVKNYYNLTDEIEEIEDV